MTTRKLTQLPLLTVATGPVETQDAEVQGWNVEPAEKDSGPFEYLDIRIEIVATDVVALDTVAYLSLTKDQALMLANDIIKEVTG